eukprot:8869504-Pyramimonas_sp.AAC.1
MVNAGVRQKQDIQSASDLEEFERHAETMRDRFKRKMNREHEVAPPAGPKVSLSLVDHIIEGKDILTPGSVINASVLKDLEAKKELERQMDLDFEMQAQQEQAKIKQHSQEPKPEPEKTAAVEKINFSTSTSRAAQTMEEAVSRLRRTVQSEYDDAKAALSKQNDPDDDLKRSLDTAKSTVTEQIDPLATAVARIKRTFFCGFERLFRATLAVSLRPSGLEISPGGRVSERGRWLFLVIRIVSDYISFGASLVR